MPSWFEDDEFWEKFRAVMFHPGRMEQSARDVALAVQLLQAAPGAEVLDMCCGFGAAIRSNLRAWDSK